MQKHQQWMDNRNYQQHLQCLTKIKQNFRKNNIKSANNFKRRRMSNKQMSQDDLSPMLHKQHKENLDPALTGRLQKNVNISSKEKQLIWNNFLLGKRIMETNPVICVKKQQDQYKKHKKLIQWRIQRSKKLAVNTDFRETKLKQFTENTNRLSNCFRLNTTIRSRYIISLRILSLSFFKHHTVLQDLVIKLRTEGKKTVQSSQIINAANLPFHQVYFKYFPRKQILKTAPKNDNQQSCIFMDMYQLKGLEQRHVGSVSISRDHLDEERKLRSFQFLKTGKLIGHIQIQFYVARKKALKETL